MTKHKKKLILNKITTIISSYAYYFNEESFIKLVKEVKIKNDLIDRKSLLHITASGAIVNSASRFGQIVFIRHPLIGKMLFPGGHFELSDIYPHNTVIREVKEEIGIKNLSLHPWHKKNNFIPIDIDVHHIPENSSKNEPSHRHIDLRYIFLTDEELLSPQSDNINFCQWQNLDLLREVYSQTLYERIRDIIYK